MEWQFKTAPPTSVEWLPDFCFRHGAEDPSTPIAPEAGGGPVGGTGSAKHGFATAVGFGIMKASTLGAAAMPGGGNAGGMGPKEANEFSSSAAPSASGSGNSLEGLDDEAYRYHYRTTTGKISKSPLEVTTTSTVTFSKKYKYCYFQT